jgi:hypothetical protein
MEYILGIIFQITVTFPFLNILRIYFRDGIFKKRLHVYGILCPINAYAVHTILLVVIFYMKDAVVNDESDASFKMASDIVYYCMTFGQVGGLLFCMVALELLPVVIDTFQQEKGLKRIRLLKWFTSIFFVLALMLSIISAPPTKIAPKAVSNYVSLVAFLWPFYALSLQMTALNMLLKHLMKHFVKYINQSPEASKKLMKALKYMLISNSIGMTLFGLGFVNFVYGFLKTFPPIWDILLMMFGFNIFFITLTLLTFYIFNVKKVASAQAMATDGISISIMKPSLSEKQ